MWRTPLRDPTGYRYKKSHPKVALAFSSKTDYLLAASEAGAAASEAAAEAASTGAEAAAGAASTAGASFLPQATRAAAANNCLLYTSDAADD